MEICLGLIVLIFFMVGIVAAILFIIAVIIGILSRAGAKKK